MKVTIVYGGKSVEHDVSILTALHLCKNCPEDWRVDLLYMTLDGGFIKSGSNGKLKNVDFYLRKNRGKKFDAEMLKNTDIVINCCHGGFGEDGHLASFLDVLGVRYTSCPPISAHNLQSKSRTREILTANGFAQPNYVVLNKKTNVNLPFPVIVKPDSLGSSIGITIAHDDDELNRAIDLAFTLDDRVIVEQFIENADEVNCSALKYGGKIMTSACEKIQKSRELFDFETKYLDDQSGFVQKRKTGGASADCGKFLRLEQAVLVHPLEPRVKELTAKAYEIFECAGVVRADFLIANDTVYLNEMNTVPGFMAYHLWLKNGLPYTTLIEMMTQVTPKTPKNVKFSSEILQKNRNLV